MQLKVFSIGSCTEPAHPLMRIVPAHIKSKACPDNVHTGPDSVRTGQPLGLVEALCDQWQVLSEPCVRVHLAGPYAGIASKSGLHAHVYAALGAGAIQPPRCLVEKVF